METKDATVDYIIKHFHMLLIMEYKQKHNTHILEEISYVNQKVEILR